MTGIRRAVVAGSWYPGAPAVLSAALDRYLDAADDGPRPLRRVVALVVPHAGLMYSGPVAAHAYRLLRTHPVDLAVLVGPSHFVGFDGVSVCRGAGFETPFGIAEIDDAMASSLMGAASIVHEHPPAHAREHSLEMQLPFLKHLAPQARIVPLVMGRQTAATARALGEALGEVLQGTSALLVASTDLSHYENAEVAGRLDAIVVDHLARFDADGLQRALVERPGHACGGGPAVAVMRAARLLGARDAVVLRYADSGDVSGDKSSVVGYVAAAFGNAD
jgi:AmmeMemoRadiSam system protein B